MSMTPAEPAIFRGVIALELRDGLPPTQAALTVAGAGDLVAMLGRDLALLVPEVRDCDLALLAAHFDPAEALRPGWPLHRRASDLLQRAPGQAGGLRILPFVLRGDAASDVGARLEDLLLDRGMAAADTALALQDGLGAAVEHVRFLSLLDLAAITAMQYQNVGLEPLWSLLEAALLEPDLEEWLDAPPEPMARHADGEVRIAMFDPCAWRKRHAADETDGAKLERGFELFQARQRQFAAVLEAHGVPVQFVHCAETADPRVELSA